MTIEALPPTTAPAAGVDLIRWAQQASAVHGLSKALASTSFIPESFRGKPEEITAAILFGSSLGLDPMIALQTITPIQGRPTISANGMRGLAQSAGVKFRLEEQNDTRVVMSAMGPGDAGWTQAAWTMDRAKKMGLTTKTNWQKMPQAMLVARCTSELCRLVAANVLLGLPYSTEEMQDGVEPVEPPAPVKTATTRTVKREPIEGPRAAVQPEVVHALQEAPPETVELPDDTTGSVTISTRTALMASFNERGLRARTERLAKVSQLLGREVASVNQITEDEGRQIISQLKAEVSWQDPA